MQIKGDVNYKNLTGSGKPSIDFKCEHCHLSYIGHNIDAYFWNCELPKSDIKKAVTEFVNCVNAKKVSHLFPKKKTGKKLLKDLCNCDKQVVDIEYHRAVKRAKKILEIGLQQLNK